jgi:hypothetical protein
MIPLVSAVQAFLFHAFYFLAFPNSFSSNKWSNGSYAFLAQWLFKT